MKFNNFSAPKSWLLITGPNPSTWTCMQTPSKFGRWLAVHILQRTSYLCDDSVDIEHTCYSVLLVHLDSMHLPVQSLCTGACVAAFVAKTTDGHLHIEGCVEFFFILWGFRGVTVTATSTSPSAACIASSFLRRVIIAWTLRDGSSSACLVRFRCRCQAIRIRMIPSSIGE